ncbi:MAG: hypothetical protein KDN20_07470 [Verrucomicrobiae bacterium]|nr:hypothetical protein [Verrucomicrobiae bacterium]
MTTNRFPYQILLIFCVAAFHPRVAAGIELLEFSEIAAIEENLKGIDSSIKNDEGDSIAPAIAGDLRAIKERYSAERKDILSESDPREASAAAGSLLGEIASAITQIKLQSDSVEQQEALAEGDAKSELSRLRKTSDEAIIVLLVHLREISQIPNVFDHVEENKKFEINAIFRTLGERESAPMPGKAKVTAAPPSNEERTWKSRGKEVTGSFVKFNGDSEVDLRVNGRLFTIPINVLSQEDRDFLGK